MEDKQQFKCVQCHEVFSEYPDAKETDFCCQECKDTYRELSDELLEEEFHNGITF